jgi:AraC-like DNA-binding protein
MVIIDPAHKPPTYWIERAMENLIRLGNEYLPEAEGARWRLRPLRKAATAAMRFSSGVHSHLFAEVCIAIAGEGAMELGDRRYRMAAPAAAVIEPGERHCEGYVRVDRGYAFVWLAGAGGSLTSNVMTYMPGRGWRGRHLGVLRSKPGQRMLALLAPEQVRDRAWRIAFRESLLAAVSDLYLWAGQYQFTALAVDSLDRHRAVLEHVLAVLDEQGSAPIAVARLAETVSLSPNYLNTLFQRWTGHGIHFYQHQRRLDRAMRLLREEGLLVKEVAYRLGYRDTFYFSRAFQKQFGVRPSTVRGAGGAALASQRDIIAMSSDAVIQRPL